MKDLSGDLQAFYRRQRLSWPAFDRACRDLRKIKYREFEVSGAHFVVQFNPTRKKNVEVAEKEDLCALCPEHLPPEQEAMPYGESFLLLCNPRPIFPYHFTIASRCHERQSIFGREQLLLKVARDLGPSFAVFYNGPRSGASLPHHFHFQACPFSLLPLSRENAGKPGVFLVKGRARRYFYLRGKDERKVASHIGKLISAWQEVSGEEGEPMLNLIASFDDGNWHVYLFPRLAHRPQRFFLEGEARLIVTPGAVEMGGVLVTVYEEDFFRLDGKMIEEIMGDVLAGEKTLERIDLRFKCRE
ncbi:MAG TPA: DUF4922 domain-containing protein [Syntrophales bacterium]|nr:DUF4922 domain-containing protein [Syntrophales bacterium]HOL60070.1 DUF4922 domain-containing protein [Syntrophales bacterium]HPO36180.1 DUF4922 domain-containing protein [Syntrophales bacterium]